MVLLALEALFLRKKHPFSVADGGAVPFVGSAAGFWCSR